MLEKEQPALGFGLFLNGINPFPLHRSGLRATLATHNVDSPTLSLPPLVPDSQYELRVRTLCSDSIYGDWLSMQFHTMTLPADTTTQSIIQSSNQAINIYPNPASGYCVVDLSGEAELKLYASDGRLFQSVVSYGSSVTLQLPSQGVFLLQVVTPEGTIARKIVNR